MKDIDPSNVIANVLTGSVITEQLSNGIKRQIEESSKASSDKEEQSLDTPVDSQFLIDDVKKNLEKLDKVIPVTTNLSFEFDENGDPPFIRVVDKGNDEVIREIPSEEFREVAKALDELADKLTSKGVLLDSIA
ncbi:flagellar biosynthesis protein FlaG [Pseudoalteromonas sp. MSK9-3]|uniref:flagellar protein FlaG n=1 Tax=Pseudoalteromonas sp. MSK9-3 TaxID=1897633 RepID=UPI000E6BBEDE|nr:flagellar protein FlaG [Pseudoalteromonas sp. MSK9-3]RJE77336.1 flagellar biosynthesis protein FlaG [Pseudoalteromonas sp. MSK9-3]